MTGSFAFTDSLWLFVSNTFFHLLPFFCVFQEGQDRIKDQIDGTGISLGSRKGVRVTGKYEAPVDLDRRSPSIVHSHTSTPIPPNISTVISICPLSHRASTIPEQGDDPRVKEVSATTGTSCSETVAPRQTMEELRTVLRDRDGGRPASPYTYLHGSSGSGCRPNGRQDDGKARRAFSTFKPQSDDSRRGGGSRENTSIQTAPNMDSSSSFRSDATTNRQPGVRSQTYESSSTWRETGASHTGQWSEYVSPWWVTLQRKWMKL